MVKRVDYEKRRTEILREAIQMFIEQGYENSSFLDIAKGCGMRLTHLYQYFHDKDEILQSMLEGLVAQIRRRIELVLEERQTPLEKMKDVIGVVGRELAQEENRLVLLLELQRSVAQESPRLLEKVNRYSQVIRKVFERLLQEGEKDGQLRVSDSEGMAFALAVLIESLVFQIALNRKFRLEEHLEEVFRFLDSFAEA